MAWQYGVAQTVAVTFYSAGEPTAPTGALSATISKDGGGFAPIGGTVAQIGATACALLSLSIADTTCDAGVVKITDAGGTADDRYVEFTTEADYTATRAGYIDAAITSREASGAAAAAVGGLHDFDPTSETVDVGAVAGACVTSVNDFKADVSALALEATLTGMKGVGWTDETLVALMAAVEALGPGLGDNTVTITLEDGDGDPVANILCIVRNVAESNVLGIATTDGSGEVEFQLDNGTYAVHFGPSGLYTFANPYTLTVSGNTDETFACAAWAVPPAPATDNVLIYGYERKVEGDAAFGASDVTVKVISVEGAFRTDAEADAQRSVVGTVYTTDATGLWSFDVSKALDGAMITLQKSYTNDAGKTITERWSATIDVTAANEAGQVSWADLQPRQG